MVFKNRVISMSSVMEFPGNLKNICLRINKFELK
jgi:hypothetical protein